MLHSEPELYDSSSDRFLQKDPIGMRDNINLYTYVANSPVMYVDPFGKEKKFVQAHDATTLLKKDMMDIRRDNFFQKVSKSGFLDDSYNPKMRSDYRDIAFEPITKENCAGESYSANCVVYFEGQEYKLDQLGNMLIGYGYTYSYMPSTLIYSAGFSVEVFKNDFNLIKANINEIDDRPYYDKGIELAINEITSTIEVLIKVLNQEYPIIF
ncbi:MAG: hypothetical protein PHY14_00590 [Candidatus Gracilibacteria bacterium]|nr:hypothetical protein [Candidatus Gracilibacteria bacterium]